MGEQHLSDEIFRLDRLLEGLHQIERHGLGKPIHRRLATPAGTPLAAIWAELSTADGRSSQIGTGVGLDAYLTGG